MTSTEQITAELTLHLKHTLAQYLANKADKDALQALLQASFDLYTHAVEQTSPKMQTLPQTNAFPKTETSSVADHSPEIDEFPEAYEIPEAGNYLPWIDDALQPVFTDFQCSPSSISSLKILLTDLSRADNGELRQTFHALNLVLYNHLSEKTLIDEQTERKQHQLYLLQMAQLKLIMAMEKDIDQLRQTPFHPLPQLLQPLKETLLTYMSLPLPVQQQLAPVLQQYMIDLFGQSMDVIKNTQNDISSTLYLFHWFLLLCQTFFQNLRAIFGQIDSKQTDNTRQALENRIANDFVQLIAQVESQVALCHSAEEGVSQNSILP